MAIISITDPTVGDPTELQKFLDVLANQRTLDAGVDVASRGNLVVNGSFESASGGTPTGWTFTDYTGGSHAIDTTNHAHGAQAISFTSTSTANGGGYCESSDFLEVTGSEVYYWFAFRMASAANVSAQITARWYDSSQTFISSSTLFQDTSAPTSLTSTEGAVAAPSTARYVKLRVEGGVPGVGTATGTVTFDDIRFRLTEVQASIGASAVGQGELKTTTANYSANVGGGTYTAFTRTGGFYTLGCQAKINSNATGTYSAYPHNKERTNNNTTGYVSYYVLQAVSGTLDLAAQETYVQASPPYDHGDGVVGLYIFAVVSGNPMKIHSMYVAPEAPWHYNGPTNVAAKYMKNGVPCRIEKGGSAGLLQGIWTPDQIATDPVARKEFLDAQKTNVEIEITQEIKHRDMPLIPHPFQMSDYPPGAKVIMLDPVCDCNFELLEMHDAGLDVSDFVYNHIKIGNQKLKRKGPPVDIVGMGWK